MRPIAIDVARSVVCVSVCWDIRAECAKTDKPVEMPFGRLTKEGPRNHVLGGGPGPHVQGNFRGGTCADPQYGTYA